MIVINWQPAVNAILKLCQGISLREDGCSPTSNTPCVSVEGVVMGALQVAMKILYHQRLRMLYHMGSV